MADFKRPFRAPPLRKRPANVVQFQSKLRPQGGRSGNSWWTRNWAYILLIVAPLLGVLAAWLWQATPLPNANRPTPVVEQYSETFTRCDGASRITCVVDGDTIWLRGVKIRIADINTPEVSSPQCPAERALGERAAGRLILLLNQGGFSLKAIDRDEDAYGRKLRIITRGGFSIGATLVNEGLAESWTGSRRNWC